MQRVREDPKLYYILFVSAVVISTTFGYIITMPRYLPPIFPTWILDANRIAPSLNVSIVQNESYRFYIGAENKMGQAQYCKLLVKFRNLTHPLPSTANATPSSLDALYQRRFFLPDDDQWELIFTFSVRGDEGEGAFRTTSIDINDERYAVELMSTWHEEIGGYNFQFLYELWLYNTTSATFVFSGIWVSSPLLQITL
jgi:hypothetical protein